MATRPAPSASAAHAVAAIGSVKDNHPTTPSVATPNMATLSGVNHPLPCRSAAASTARVPAAWTDSTARLQPPPVAPCARAAMKAITPHTSQLPRCGEVRPRRISNRLRTVPIRLSTTPTAPAPTTAVAFHGGLSSRVPGGVTHPADTSCRSSVASIGTGQGGPDSAPVSPRRGTA